MRKKHYMIVLLPILLFIGCGKTEKSGDIQSLRMDKVVISNTLPGIENALLNFEDFYETVIDAENKIVYSVNPLEGVESATVSDGIYNITLMSQFNEFEEDYPEEEFGERGKVNLVGYTEIEGIRVDFYYHLFSDVIVYTTYYNLLNGEKSGYFNYIYRITLSTPRFQTSDGLKVGMTEAELKEKYGNSLMKDEESNYDGSYDYIYRNDEVEFRFHIDFQGIIESISVSV